MIQPAYDRGTLLLNVAEELDIPVNWSTELSKNTKRLGTGSVPPTQRCSLLNRVSIPRVRSGWERRSDRLPVKKSTTSTSCACCT